MKLTDHSCAEFIELLASKAPVPGGGGASALAAALGTALGNMVGSLTVGKKKYAGVETRIYEMKARCDALQAELLDLVQQDAEVFEPLSRAYGMPKDTEEQKAERERVLEAALDLACGVPLKIMEKCCEAIALMEEFAQKGSRLALSDAGVGSAFCRAALEGAALNVFINTKLMKDRARADELNEKAEAMLRQYGHFAAQTYDMVRASLR